MAAYITYTLEFDTQKEAEDWASLYRLQMMGYDPRVVVRQSGDKWVADVSRYDSCD